MSASERKCAAWKWWLICMQPMSMYFAPASSARWSRDDEILQRLLGAGDVRGDQRAVAFDRRQRLRIGDFDRHRQLAAGEPKLERHLAEVGGIERDVEFFHRLRRLGLRGRRGGA